MRGKSLRLSTPSASTAWKLDMASTASAAALAIAKAVGSAPWPWNIPAITFATGIGIAQVSSQSMAKPVEPVKPTTTQVVVSLQVRRMVRQS